ncbi:hypothetical protein B0H67DRAFT_642262 [Lasiosphaeris hirsuta]|uniref:Uncharacterized protein n=1 Tax=Lasiosphaeris hirsuta TaxID=260670 RepID=A0AA40B1K1_9PEZI|nr:hypothetical protein B0H67DRAFT_642262 [Lasiosphaeris hirsuta]
MPVLDGPSGALLEGVGASDVCTERIQCTRGPWIPPLPWPDLVSHKIRPLDLPLGPYRAPATQSSGGKWAVPWITMQVPKLFPEPTLLMLLTLLMLWASVCFVWRDHFLQMSTMR